MLEFFRRYQQTFFLVTAVVVIASFLFFGAYGTFDTRSERKDWAVSTTVGGSKLMFSEVQMMSRFIAADRNDPYAPRGMLPNFSNDGVIRNDFLKDRLADLIVAEYFDVLKEDFEGRLEKAKRYRPYVHPQADFLSANSVWNHYLPEMNGAIEALKQEIAVTPSTFSHLKEIYLLEGYLPPEILRKILIHQHQQLPRLPVDPRLSYDDLAVFGYHGAVEWFGRNFVDLVSEFILNAASAAEKKGYRVTLQEAKGDLIHHFRESMQTLGSNRPEISFHQHLSSFGFDERSAAYVWQKVLLFRKYFRDVGEAALVDRMPYQEFSQYANASAAIECYTWPIRIQNQQDLAAVRCYIEAIGVDTGELLPTKIKEVHEVEKQFPKLIRTRYRAQKAEVAIEKIAARVTLKELWNWQKNEANWAQLRKEFSLGQADTAEHRFTLLEHSDPSLRAEVDAFSRQQIVKEHPEWVEEELDQAPFVESVWSVYGNDPPFSQRQGVYTRIKDLEIVEDKHILPFHEAQDYLREYVGKAESEFVQDKNPFLIASISALESLKSNSLDPRWVQSGANPLFDQFKLEKKSLIISRTSKEDWMKNKAFTMLPDLWSPVHVIDGQVAFFYLKERKATPAPILDQLSVGKETLASDAKAFFAERFLQTVKEKNAIVIPLQKEGE